MAINNLHEYTIMDKTALEQGMHATAEAIRLKTGSYETLYWNEYNGFADYVNNIPVGGGGGGGGAVAAGMIVRNLMEFPYDDVASAGTIGPYAFAGMFQGYPLDITLPASVSTIGQCAFMNCGIGSITISADWSYIGDRAFANSDTLRSVSYPLNAVVGQTGDGCFENCTNLWDVTLPQNLTSVKPYTFRGCTNLRWIRLPDSVNAIYAYAFENSALEEIQLETPVNYIGEGAFMNCAGLNKIILVGTAVKTLESALAFEGTPIADGTGTIYINCDVSEDEAELVAAYKAADGWSTYANVIKPISEMPVAE